MSETKYLKAILKITESPSRVRKLFYYHAAWVVASILVIYFISRLELMPPSTAVLFVGMFVGFFIAKLEGLYNLRYLLRHIDTDSIKSRISQ